MAFNGIDRREALADGGIADAIMHRSHARRRLAPWQRWMNVVLASIRGQAIAP
ncbi:hypothetical protein GCM10011504_58130 [Siccirubricoccus deserti]|uniref:Uncharacterized protein n=1 Tax=Siccirubricoccus deserti TaxID=2013562 RepID=A0A9X0R3V3_9PROT|nr:hypothetical protein [Siccirubricoccus deserti]MBC4019220.1 hypothetical protein [Siccirubricoccus deserti]GGC73061.1 hypothetical protein GCM10011504_58130 [Siccirubricoccus deserti]